MLSNMTSMLEQNKFFGNSERPLVVDLDIMPIHQKLFNGKFIELATKCYTEVGTKNFFE